MDVIYSSSNGGSGGGYGDDCGGCYQEANNNK